MGQNTSSTPSAPIQEQVEKSTFDQLLRRFKECDCEANAFVTAVYLYQRFPEEARKLLPRIKGEQLVYDGKSDSAGTTYEWAAALTAANKFKEKRKIPFENIEESAISKEASRIYVEIVKDPSCKAR